MHKHRIDKRIDIFHLNWIQGAFLCGEDEIPLTVSSKEIPYGVIPFSVAVRKKKKLSKEAYKCYVHFFEHDYKFARLFHNPKKYLKRLKKFAGVISPDVSVFYNTPKALQRYNVFLSRAISFFLQKNGINVISLARWGKENSYQFAFCGLEQNSSIFVSPYGCTGDKEENDVFYSGFWEMIKRVHPSRILFFGTATLDIRNLCSYMSIQLVEYKIKSYGDKISLRRDDSTSYLSLPLFKEVV